MAGRGDIRGQAKKGRKRILGRKSHMGKGLAGGKLWAAQEGFTGRTRHRGGSYDAWKASNAVLRSDGDFLHRCPEPRCYSQSDCIRQRAVGLKQGEGGEQTDGRPRSAVWRCLPREWVGEPRRVGKPL